MSYRVVFAELSLLDLDSASEYIKIKLCNMLAAERLVERFFSEAGSLDFFPTRFPLCKDKILRAWGVRFVPVGKYLLFYVVKEEEQTVYVIRFLYSRRDWQKILREQIENDNGAYSPAFTTNYIQEETEKYNQ